MSFRLVLASLILLAPAFSPPNSGGNEPEPKIQGLDFLSRVFLSFHSSPTMSTTKISSSSTHGTELFHSTKLGHTHDLRSLVRGSFLPLSGRKGGKKRKWRRKMSAEPRTRRKEFEMRNGWEHNKWIPSTKTTARLSSFVCVCVRWKLFDVSLRYLSSRFFFGKTRLPFTRSLSSPARLLTHIRFDEG